LGGLVPCGLRRTLVCSARPDCPAGKGALGANASGGYRGIEGCMVQARGVGPQSLSVGAFAMS
jgi:hypothetical protein